MTDTGEPFVVRPQIFYVLTVPWGDSYNLASKVRFYVILSGLQHIENVNTGKT